LPHFKIKIETDYSTSKTFSHMIRTVEAADLECAAKQARKDLETMQKVFHEWVWQLSYIEQVEPPK
jgi:hypothetical protein